MKVYVICEAKLFQGERVTGVASTLKKAEDIFRKKYPHMRKFNGGNGEYNAASDATNKPTLLFIHEREVDK